MRSSIQLLRGSTTIDELLAVLSDTPDVVLLQSAMRGRSDSRYSFFAAHPMMTIKAFGTDCHLYYPSSRRGHTLYGNPWAITEHLMQPFEVMEELDSPFPLGGCFGYWGYDLKQFVEPKLERRAVRRSNLPDAYLGLYASLLVIDHQDKNTYIVATGFRPDGSRSQTEAIGQMDRWKQILDQAQKNPLADLPHVSHPTPLTWSSKPDRETYIQAVIKAQQWIGQGDIYQVNLARELASTVHWDAITCYCQLQAMSPAPYSGFINEGSFQILGASPESFLRMDGRHIQTRPIKGTRPRGVDAQEDARLAYELQSSDKERAELLMITDLLRNDLGRVCDYGSVTTPDLMCLERYPQVHHLVSTVEGILRKDVSHLKALYHCFPGGSITGAPKFRAMEIIEALEPQTRGPYTGSMGYLGFNQTSQLNIIIRTAVKHRENISLHVGAGIVADSDPEAEFQETEDKAAGFFASFASLNTLSENQSALERKKNIHS